jgi:CcmD family protein
MTMQGETPSATPSTPNGRSTSFEAVQGGEQHYSGETLLVSAYAILWAVVFVWVALVWRKQSTMNARLSELEREIDKAAAKQDEKKV